MSLKLQPIIILGRHGCLFHQPSGTLNIVTEEEALESIVQERLQELRAELSTQVDLLPEQVVRYEADLVQLKRETLEADAILGYLLGVMPVQAILGLKLPVIGFSGRHTPMLALDAFAEEKVWRRDVNIALDFQDIADQCRLLAAQKRLRETRIALVGFPPPWFSRWYRFTDPERARQKLGVEFTSVELRELTATLNDIDDTEARLTVQKWAEEARQIREPSEVDLRDAARIYLALTQLLKRRKANALALNCQEMVYSMHYPPPCYPLSCLRDEDIAAACEDDVPALLSMLVLGYVADKPAFMGNIARAVPASNQVLISHCVVPTKMAGFDKPAAPNIMRNYHGHEGDTSWVELDNTGQEVTLGRLDRNLERMALARGRIVECRDTVACRTTFAIELDDVRQFIQNAPGNHFALVYGDWSQALKALGQALDLQAIGV